MLVWDEMFGKWLWKDNEKGVSVPFNHPLIAGSRLKYKLWKMTSPSFNSDSFGTGYCLMAKVSLGMMAPFGRFASTTAV